MTATTRSYTPPRASVASVASEAREVAVYVRELASRVDQAHGRVVGDSPDGPRATWRTASTRSTTPSSTGRVEHERPSHDPRPLAR